MRSILDAESSRGLIILPLLIGLLTTPGIALSLAATFPEHSAMLWLGCALLSVLGYWMYVHASGIGYRWIGSWMGGQGTKAQLQLCLAWSQLPFIYIATVFLPIHFIFRDVLYPEIDMVILINPSLSDITALTRQLSPTYYLINTLLTLPCIYAYLLSLKLMGEAHRFSAWKALAVKLIALALHIPLFGALFIIMALVMVVAVLLIV